jgi:hypothetical protein
MRVFCLFTVVVLCIATASAITVWDEKRDGVDYRVWEDSHADLPVGIYSAETMELARAVRCTDTHTGEDVGLYDVIEHLKPTPDTARTRDSMLTLALTAICHPSISFVTRDRRHTVDETAYEATDLCLGARLERVIYDTGRIQRQRYVDVITRRWSDLCLPVPADLETLESTCLWWAGISNWAEATPRPVNLPGPIIPGRLFRALTPSTARSDGRCHQEAIDALLEACKDPWGYLSPFIDDEPVNEDELESKSRNLLRYFEEWRHNASLAQSSI